MQSLFSSSIAWMERWVIFIIGYFVFTLHMRSEDQMSNKTQQTQCWELGQPKFTLLTFSGQFNGISE